MKKLRFFSGSTGLNTSVDPVRVDYDPKTGVSDMVEGVNVVIDSTLRPCRRSGYSLAQVGNYHSLFCDGGDCFVAMDTDLYRVAPDLSLVGIRSGLSGHRIAYAQVNNEAYYCNGADNGIVRDGVSCVWAQGTYNGPETSRQFSGPPVGNHLAFHLGRIFISVNDVLWWSEPYNFGLYDKVRNWLQMTSHIRMIKPVEEGMFISDSQATYFLGGKAPGEFFQKKVANVPAYEWSDAIDLIDAQELDLDVFGLCAVWSSQEGVNLGLPTGQVIKLNKKKMTYPAGLQQGAGLVDDSHFLHTLF